MSVMDEKLEIQEDLDSLTGFPSKQMENMCVCSGLSQPVQMLMHQHLLRQGLLTDL